MYYGDSASDNQPTLNHSANGVGNPILYKNGGMGWVGLIIILIGQAREKWSNKK